MTIDSMKSTIFKIAQREQGHSVECIRVLAEGVRQKLWGQNDYGKMRKWLVKDCQVSNGSAHRRVNAALLAACVPVACDRLKRGELNLTVLMHAQSALHQEEIRKKAKIPLAVKRALVNKLVGKTVPEAQRMLAEDFPKAKSPPKERLTPTPDGWSLTIRLTNEMMEELRRYRASKLPANPNATWAELIHGAIQKIETNQIAVSESAAPARPSGKGLTHRSPKPIKPAKRSKSTPPRSPRKAAQAEAGSGADATRGKGDRPAPARPGARRLSKPGLFRGGADGSPSDLKKRRPEP